VARRQYKHEYTSTLDDARRVLKRFRATAKPLGYVVALFGSTVLTGKGHDIDVQIMASNDEDVTPKELAMLLMKKHAKSILKWEQIETNGMEDVWINFVTHDGLYIDMHIKGGADGP
jgi:hypothetical protein